MASTTASASGGDGGPEHRVAGRRRQRQHAPAQGYPGPHAHGRRPAQAVAERREGVGGRRRGDERDRRACGQREYAHGEDVLAPPSPPDDGQGSQSRQDQEGRERSAEIRFPDRCRSAAPSPLAGRAATRARLRSSAPARATRDAAPACVSRPAMPCRSRPCSRAGWWPGRPREAPADQADADRRDQPRSHRLPRRSVAPRPQQAGDRDGQDGERPVGGSSGGIAPRSSLPAPRAAAAGTRRTASDHATKISSVNGSIGADGFQMSHTRRPAATTSIAGRLMAVANISGRPPRRWASATMATTEAMFTAPTVRTKASDQAGAQVWRAARRAADRGGRWARPMISEYPDDQGPSSGELPDRTS